MVHGWVGVGNVTVPANQAIPQAGVLVEVRYLYAHDGGSLFQPVLLGVRDDITEEEYDRIMNINTKATFLACQVFGRYFVDNKIAASIINLGSMSGLIPLSRVFTYSMSKGAVHNLSRNLAREWAPLGIRVNTLVPGFFTAEQNKKVLVPERVAKIMAHTPMARFGEAKELVGAALLLAANGAGSFITGHELVVDGGYSAMTI